VYVVGAVRHPGLYNVSGNARVNDAIASAGGMLPAADPAAVNLAERVHDGAEIRVPRTGEAAPAPARRTRPRARKTKAIVSDATVDLNEADAQTLGSLPGIGGTLAARIVEYREVNGPFASLDELADVAGMTQRRIDTVTPYLRVGPAH
jgi:competence protein ComEA